MISYTFDDRRIGYLIHLQKQQNLTYRRSAYGQHMQAILAFIPSYSHNFICPRQHMYILSNSDCPNMPSIHEYMGYQKRTIDQWTFYFYIIFHHYIEKNCIQSIQCCISRRSKTAKIKCYKQCSFRAGTHRNAVPVLFLTTGTPFRSFSSDMKSEL